MVFYFAADSSFFNKPEHFRQVLKVTLLSAISILF